MLAPISSRASFSFRHPLSLTDPALIAAVLAGVVAVQVLPSLPPLWLNFGLLLLSLLLLCRLRPFRLIAAVLLGFGWCAMRADFSLSSRLSVDLEGQDLQITGSVRDLPRVRDEATQFDFDVETAALDGDAIDLKGHVRLSWYGQAPTLEPCAQWQLRVRMKRPRGLINPGAYDFERRALESGINAVGYVRDDVGNRRLATVAVCIDGWRERLSQGIANALGDTGVTPLLRALAVGDQRYLDEHDWQVLRATGIGHLIAISGMHIGMLAGFGVLFIRLLWRLRPRLVLRWPAPMLEAPFGLMCAFIYSGLAGFGLPTDRTLIMIAVVVLATLARRAMTPIQALRLALLVLLLFDPLSVLSPGFWLSFVGVAWLVFCLDRGNRKVVWWRELISAQVVMTIGLLPLTVWFFGSASMVGPIANLIAVPWVSFIVVPLTIAGGLLLPVAPGLGVPIIKLAAWAMQGQWWLLERQATWPGAQWYLPEPSFSAFALALFGAAWLLLPRGIPARGLGLLLFLPLLLPRLPILAEGMFEAMMIDVGQGLAVVVRTHDHVLVYDTGPRYPSGFDLGETAVVPTLHAFGIEHVDRLIISHGDNDHAGGARALVTAYPPDISESSQPRRVRVPVERCRAGESWQWNEVHFELVHPPADFPDLDNDSSCVLAVRSGDAELVLTGDISAKVEPQVAEALAPVAAKLALTVPHHGSKTSSSPAFLASLHPSLGLVSAGYRNRFGHPHPDVVQRYKEAGIELINTANSGFVRIRFSPDGSIAKEEQGRLARHPYWRER